MTTKCVPTLIGSRKKHLFLFALLVAFLTVWLAGAAFALPQLKWISINGGGASFGSGGPLKLGYTVGQSVSGAGSGGGLNLGIGFWQATCAALKGDMNFDDIYTSADVVLLLNCTYLGLGSCDACFSDVNCDGILTSADVVLELNKTYLGLNAPPWCGP